MAEQEEEKKEEKVEEIPEPSAATSTDLVERAEAAAKRIEDAIEKNEAILRKNQEIEAKRILGGKSEAAPEPEKKEESPKEYADRVMRGEIEEAKK